jgi:PAS domain S-box-containing protein
MHQLRVSEIKPVILQNMLENLPVGLMVIDGNGEIITINRSASEILGHSLDAFEGKGWGELFIEGQKNRDFNQVIVDIIWDRKVNLRRQVPYIRSDGKTLQLSITGSFLREENGIAGIVVLMNDVTELHQAHENEKAVLEEKSAIEHEKAESLRKLAEAVAHQIRNPVTAIGGFSRRILKRLDPNDPNRQYLETIIHGTRRLENVVTVVADYTALMEIRPEKVTLSAVMDIARAGLAQKEAELCKEVEWNIRIPPVELLVDPGLFARALNELFLNALEFSTENHICIGVDGVEEADGVTVVVTDSGPGIPDADMPYIFNPFFTTKAVGVGMGMCRVERIVSEHKGDLSVDSIPGKGTRATIYIPGIPSEHS